MTSPMYFREEEGINSLVWVPITLIYFSFYLVWLYGYPNVTMTCKISTTVKYVICSCIKQLETYVVTFCLELCHCFPILVFL